jgi:two-component system LytT family response regulator
MENLGLNQVSRPGAIRAMIIDDEIGAIKTLRQMLTEYCPDIEVVGVALSIHTAVLDVGRLAPDVVFLDIEMPPLGNGFDFLKNCGRKNFGVVFTTAYPQYAIYAINNAQPWAYLVKPFSVEELVSTVETAKVKMADQAQIDATNGERKGIIIQDKRKGSLVLHTSEILMCKADGSFTVFYTRKDGNIQKIIASGRLGGYESMLPPELFCRIHHSYLVNLAYVDRIIKTGRNGVIQFKNTELQAAISVSRMEYTLKGIRNFLSTRRALQPGLKHAGGLHDDRK